MRASALLLLLLLLALAVPRDAAAASPRGGDCFGPFIEGAAVNKAGKVFAVNAGPGSGAGRNAIGVASGSSCEVHATVSDKPGTSLNSIRVLPSGAMLSTDTKNARVVQVSADGKSAKTYCGDAGMVEPNDIALSRQGLVYVSGQRWTDNTAVGDGGVWLCRGPGRGEQLLLLGRTNGIELSPDDKYLYVSEAFNKGGTPVSNKIWRFTLKPDGLLGTKTLFRDFADEGTQANDVDGMRADTAGNLYVARYGGAEVVKLSPADGKTLKTYKVPFSSPTNVELGGPDGKTLYVVGRCGMTTKHGEGSGCVAVFGVDGPPGRAWTMLQAGLPAKL